MLDLDAIEARAEAATAGVWVADDAGDPQYDPRRLLTAEGRDLLCGDDGGGAWVDRTADAVFIAHARGDVPAMAREIRRLRAWLDTIAYGPNSDKAISMTAALDALDGKPPGKASLDD